MDALTPQQRFDRIRSFRDELSELGRQGVLSLTDEQRQSVDDYHAAVSQRLLADHDLDTSDSARHLSWGMQAVSFLGAWALAASVFFFFQQYWGQIDVVWQLAVLWGASLGSLAGTACLARVGVDAHFVKIAAMIAFACFAINVTLLGELFNLPPSPNALLLLALYGAVLAYALRVRLLLAVAILCAFGFIGAQTATWSGTYWLSVGRRPEHFFLPALAFFALPSVISQARYEGFAVIYRVLSLVAFLLCVLVLSNWASGSYWSASGAMVEGFYQTVGFVVSAAAIVLAVKAGWRAVLVTGNAFFFLFLYTKFYDWWWDWLPKSVFFLLIGLTALLALFVFTRLRRAQREGGGFV